MTGLRAPLLALAITASLALGPAQAATLQAGGPLDFKSIAPAQRLSLPDSTTTTIRGKVVTLGALRAAHAALLAYFQSVGSLKSLVHFTAPIKLTREINSASPGLYNQAITPQSGTPATPAPAATKHVPNIMTSGPIDYMAACGQISVCVFIPPAMPAVDNAAGTFTSSGTLYVTDALLSSDVCAADGGTYYGDFGCQFGYPMDAQASMFPGNPPAMTASVSCPNVEFSTVVDPLGAAKIHSNTGSPQGSAAIVCAINIFVPSS